MTDEEIERFALVLKECERIRALIAREEAVLSNGEHDDGIPIATAPPEQQPPVLPRVTATCADTAWGLLAHSTRAIHPSAWKGFSQKLTGTLPRRSGSPTAEPAEPQVASSGTH